MMTGTGLTSADLKYNIDDEKETDGSFKLTSLWPCYDDPVVQN